MTKSSETDQLDTYVEFLKINDWTRFNDVKKILDFYIAGEDNNKMMLFFLLLGNYHQKLMPFVLYRGDSSAGKNFVVENVLKLFPDKDVYIYDSATAKALNYDADLNNAKIIYLRELEQQQSNVEMLKSLYNANGRIHKETIKDGRTDEHSVKEHVLNRKGIITTFSFENIQVDVVNRGWVLVPDQSYEQTQKIIDFDIDLERNLIERKSKKKEMEHRCFFVSQCVNALNFEYEVFIPYVNKLDVLLPNTHLNVRRDKNKLFNLIKIITLWNQYNRKSVKMDDTIYLLAEYNDLKMALQMCEQMFINLVLHLDDTKKSILDYMEATELVEIKSKKEQQIVTDTYGNERAYTEVVDRTYSITEIHEEIRDDMSISRVTVKRKLDDLFYEGYLLREKPKGRLTYKKLRDYSLINVLKLDEIEDEINTIVKEKFFYYNIRDKEEIPDDGF